MTMLVGGIPYSPIVFRTPPNCSWRFGKAHLTAMVLSVMWPLALSQPAIASETSTTPRPSIVLVVIDTLRKDHLSLYGYAKPTSPGLEELAKESVVFENCLAPSSWTKPSIASLMTRGRRW